jgi:DNA replication protein DnaC
MFMNIPDAYRYCHLSDFKKDIYRTEEGKQDAKMVVSAVSFWLKNLDEMRERGKGIYFSSLAKGSGKTMMATALANKLSKEHGLQVKYATSVQIVNEIKASWNDHSREENDLLEALVMAEVLFLDDFGMEQEGGEKNWINERFFHIINERYAEKKLTFFTSNKEISALQYDDRIKNRILEMTFQVPFPEESVREYIAQREQFELWERTGGGV